MRLLWFVVCFANVLAFRLTPEGSARLAQDDPSRAAKKPVGTSVFPDLDAFASGSVNIPSGLLQRLTAPVADIVQTARTTSNFADVIPRVLEKSEHVPFNLASEGKWAWGPLYQGDGTPKSGMAWYAPSWICHELKEAAEGQGFVLRSIHVINLDLNWFASSHQDSFWLAVAALTHKDTDRALFLVSSRGSQGAAEWLANVGLFQEDVASEVTSRTTKALSWAKWALRKEYILPAVNLPEELMNSGSELREDVKGDVAMLQNFLDINVTTASVAEILKNNLRNLAQSLKCWTDLEYLGGCREEQTYFGGWFASWGQPRPSFLFRGNSLGGCVTTLVGLHLKYLNSLSSDPLEKVAGFSVNSMGVAKLTADMPYAPSLAPDFGIGFVNMVTQHDIIWKIGEQFGQGQKVCMFMHPAEENGCKTGDDQFPRWAQLSDAINVECLDGMLDAKSTGWLSYSPMPINLGNGVMKNMWRCQELFGDDSDAGNESAAENRGPKGCWSKEHNPPPDMFIGKPVTDRKPGTDNGVVTLSDLKSYTGRTFWGDELVADRQARRDKLDKDIRKLTIEKQKELDGVDGPSSSSCSTDASPAFCCEVNAANECIRAVHGGSKEPAAGNRTSCHTARSPTKCNWRVSGRYCACALGHCFQDGKCVPSIETTRDEINAKYDKAVRVLKRYTHEGPLDLNWDGHIVCQSDARAEIHGLLVADGAGASGPPPINWARVLTCTDCT